MTAEESATSEPAAPAAPKKRSKALLVAVPLVVLVLLAGALVVYSQPEVPKPYTSPISKAMVQKNGDLFLTLSAAGFRDLVVDVNGTRAVAAYNTPAYMTNATDLLNTQRFVLATVAEAAPTGGSAFALQYANHQQTLGWRVSVADYQAFKAGTLTLEQFEERIEKGTG